MQTRLGDVQRPQRGVQTHNRLKLPVAEQCTQQLPFATAQIKHTDVAPTLEQHLHHLQRSGVLEAERTLSSSLCAACCVWLSVRVGIVIVRETRQRLAGQAPLVFEIRV